jgi:flagellar biosynthesis protein FliR
MAVIPGPLVSLILAWLGPSAVVLARCGGLACTAPGLGTPGLGWRIRVGLAGLLAVLLVPVVGPEMASLESADPAIWARWCLAEAAIGLGLGLASGLVLAGARQAGELVGIQAGLATASLFDPEAGDGMTPPGHFYGLIALASFLTLGGPLRLVSALIESYRAIPAGGTALSEETARAAFERIGWALGLALQAAAPAAVALMVAGLALGLIARVGGTLQLASLTWPVRSALGMVLTLLGLAMVAGQFGDAWLRVLP